MKTVKRPGAELTKRKSVEEVPMKKKKSAAVASDVKEVTRATLRIGGKKRIVAEFSDFKGKDYLNVRQQVQNAGGEFVFTPAGFNIPDTPEDMEAALKFFRRIVTMLKQKTGA